MGRWVLVVVLSGCGSVLGLDEVYQCPPNDDDCDKLLDNVDPCPADPNDVSDGDGDGVGDACDPNVETPGDTIARFDGFGVRDLGWTVFSGDAQWSWRDSLLAQDDVATGAIELPIDVIYQPTVEVFMNPDFEGDGSIIGVYVLATTGSGANIPLECRIVHYETHDDLIMILRTRDDAPLITMPAPSLPGKRTDGLRIYGGQLPDGTVRCRARYGDADSLYVDLKGWVTPRAMMDRVGLRTVSSRAEFRSVVVYAVP